MIHPHRLPTDSVPRCLRTAHLLAFALLALPQIVLPEIGLPQVLGQQTAQADMTVTSFTHTSSPPLGDVVSTQDNTTPDENGTYQVPGGTISLYANHSDTPFSLSAEAGIALNQFDAPEWQSTLAQAFAEVSMIDTAQVQGSPDGATGTLRFTWALVGTESLKLESGSGTFDVTTFSTSATLTSDVLGGTWDEPFNSFHKFPAGHSADFDENFSPSAPTLTYEVPWTDGTDVSVSFNLAVETLLEFHSMGDTAPFTASLDASFFNTADLETVQVFQQLPDSSLVLLPDAYLQSTIGGPTYPVTAVPEPAIGLWMTALALPLLVAKRCLKRRAPRA